MPVDGVDLLAGVEDVELGQVTEVQAAVEGQAVGGGD